ncbi:DNA topoisomerase IV subunit A [compost metagenome]
MYTAIHQDGKSGTYYVKRFKFDDIPVGKSMLFINDEPGSKLILLTNNTDPIVHLDILKGKSQTEEALDQPLNEIIDVKGMKAQGNRLSFHTVKSVTLTTEEIDLTVNTKEGSDPNPEGPESDEETHKTEADAQSDDIKLEITNSDDIQTDNGGQIELF